MKVRQQMIDCLEAVWGTDEDPRLSRTFREGPIGEHRALESADTRSSDSPRLTPAAADRIESRRGFARHPVRLLMHDVMDGIVNFDRLEGAGADVQNHICARYTFGGERVEKLGCEMKSRGGSCDRARLDCVHRLVSLGVSFFVGSTDVRRKRDVPVSVDGCLGGQRRAKLHHSRSALCRLENLDLEVRTDVNHSSGLELSTGMHHCLIAIVAERPEKKQLSRGAGIASAEQAGSEHTSRVENHHIARRDDAHDVAKYPVLYSLCVPMQNEQTALVTPCRGGLGDQLRRKLEVVVAGERAAAQKSEGCD